MRIPKKRETISPMPTAFHVGGRTDPQALEREATTKSQKDFLEGTIIWGEDNAFPLRLAQAVNDSPAASSCISTIAKFIRGAKFSDPDLMKLKVNKNGQTLWDLHCQLSNFLAMFRGFAVNFKFNEDGGITNAYIMAIENCRFVKPEDDLATDIKSIKYNPYFGTQSYNKKYTKEYNLWDPLKLDEQIKKQGTKFGGQVYYYGEVRPMFKFYPMPEYWSAKKWIQIDGKIQEAHAENLDNGFFQSVLMSVIGDPAAPSKNPAYMVEKTKADGVTKYKESTKTVGDEFNEMMSSAFSGSKKMGTVLVQWALRDTEAPKLQAFPTNTNADLFLALQDLTTKNITIATKVPGILANISEGTNLGSGGSEIQKAVELMQSNTDTDRRLLEQFYNEVLLPRLDLEDVKQKIPKNAEVEIQNYNPITVPVEIDDKFWDVLDLEEKRDFVRKNFSSIDLKDPEPQTDAEGNDLPEEDRRINETMKKITGREQQQFIRIIRQYSQGKLNEAAATIQLKGFGLTDEEVRSVLGLDEVPIEPATTPPVQMKRA